MRLPNGVTVDVSDVEWKYIFEERVYDHWSYQRDWTVVDLGAFYGVFSFYVYSMVRHVYAVEPVPEVCEVLRRAVEDNGIENVTVVEAAIGSETGTFPFTVYRRKYASSFKPSKCLYDVDRIIEVRTYSWEDFLGEYNILNVDYAKLDIEGSEADVLYSMETLPKRIVVAKYHERYFHCPDANYLRQLMKEKGYRIVRESEENLFGELEEV